METTATIDIWQLNQTFASTYNLTTKAPPSWDCTVIRFALNSVFMGIMCVVGFLSNTLSLVVLHRDRQTPLASFLLRCIAVADNCYIFVWIIQYSLTDFLRFFNFRSVERHNFWLLLRVYTYPALYVAQTEMIWLTVLIALNRFIAVCLPYNTSTLCSAFKVRALVVGVTVFSVLYNVPRFCERYLVFSANSTRLVRTSLEMSALYKTIYIDVLYYIFSFILPLLILGFCNTFVIIKYRTMLKRKRHMMLRKRDAAAKEQENSVTVVMIVVVLVFMVCQAPARLVQIVWSYSYDHCRQFQYYLSQVSNTLEVLNSSLNFVVYCLFHRQFRTILGRQLCCTKGNNAEDLSNGDASLVPSLRRTTTVNSTRNGTSHFTTVITATDVTTKNISFILILVIIRF